MKCKISIFIVVTSCLLLFSCRHRNRIVHSRETTKIAKQENIPKSSVSVMNSGKSVVKMNKENGVYHVPCKINGTEMEFIFDTGASDITMSLTEALFLYKQAKLKKEDIIGKQQYQIADGSIHEGMIVVLRKVEIGNCVLTNVQASIVDNMEAPLLLGQSALTAFGKISIDYNRNEITFE